MQELEISTLNFIKTLSRRLPLALLLQVWEKLDECRHINKKYISIDSVLLAVHKRNHSNRNVKCINDLRGRGVFRPRQTRQLPRAVDLKGRLLSCQSY